MKEKNFEQAHSYKPPKGGFGKPSIEDEDREYEEKFNLSNVCSSGDCTGLMQNVPLTDSELESYQALYSFAASDAAQKENEKESEKRGE